MKITVKLSETFRQQQFVATGENQPAVVTVEVNPTEKQREQLIEAVQLSYLFQKNLGTGEFDFSKNSEVSINTTDPATVVIQLLNAVTEMKRKKAEAEKAETEKQAAREKEKQQTIAENRTKYLNNKQAARSYSDSYYNNLDDETKAYIEAQKAAHKEEKEAAETAQKEVLKTWAIENGSDLLKACISDGFNWQKLANQEWFAANTQDGFSYEEAPDDFWDIQNPTLEQIKSLRDIRKTQPSAVLRRYKYVHEGYEEEANHFDFLCITLTSPTGDTQVIEKAC